MTCFGLFQNSGSRAVAPSEWLLLPLLFGLSLFPVGCDGGGAREGGDSGAGTHSAGSTGGSVAGSGPQGGAGNGGVSAAGAAGSSAGSGSGAGGNAGLGGNSGSAGGAGVSGAGVSGAGVSGSAGADTSGGVGGTAGAGGTAAGAGGSAVGACTHQCVDRCLEWGGMEQAGTCEGAQVCCSGATPPEPNPLSHLAPSAEEVGLLLANRFLSRALSFSSVANLPGDGYKTACEWYGALSVAKLTDSQELLDALVTKFAPFKTDFVDAMLGGEAHVDRYIFGIVPLEIYLQTGDESYLPLGTETADDQQVTNQTRDAIDDMFMMTGLQLQAYRATNDAKYIGFMAETMVDYLGAQQSNGLFFHNETQARVHWGRGNGWFAAGMAEIMRDLPEDSPHYQTILSGYTRMMEGLLPYQSDNGLWYQVLDMPNDPSNWEESSGSAMFAYAMVAGVRRGVLPAETFVPVIEATWAGLRSRISAQGDVSGICVGTWYKANAQEYMALARLMGDGHGQAPVLWAAAELLR
jgi:unsaturated rhamnogalacturonyl hydrolase